MNYMMRVCLVRLLSVIFISALLAFPATAQDEVPNLVQNPGFEDLNGAVAVGWSATSGGWDGGTISTTREAARSGEVGVKIAGAAAWVHRVVPIEPEKTYELAVWAKGSGSAQLKFEFVCREPEGEEERSGCGEKWQGFSPTAEWSRATLRATAPPLATDVRILLRLTSREGTHVYYDDVTLYAVDEDGNPISVDIASARGERASVRPDPGAAPGAAPDTSHFAQPDLVKEVLAGNRTEADASWWGFDPEDSTAYLQAAINSGVSRLTIPNMGHDWVVRPITLRSNMELVFEDGVVVTAKKGEYRGTSDSVFTGRNVENIIMRGYGATIRMHKDDYTRPPYPRGEWRMGIRIYGGKNIQILGLTIRDSGGDAIYIGTGNRKWSEDIVIRDVVMDNNFRQGVSVISVKNLLIENSVVKNTSGTPPAAGIDFEPNGPEEVLQDIVIRNTVFEGNEGPGVAIYPGRLKSDSEISFLLENILVRDNPIGINISVGTPDDHAGGEIVIRNCLVENSSGKGIGIRNKDGDGLRLTIEDCIVHNTATGPDPGRLREWTPIFVDGGSRVGGITFNNVVVTDNRDRPALFGAVRTPSHGDVFFDIDGELYVVNPFGADILWNGHTKDVTLRAVSMDSVVIDTRRFVTLPEVQVPPFEVIPTPESDDSPLLQCKSLGENILLNPGFEIVQDGAPNDWNAYIPGRTPGWSSEVVTATSKAARTGDVGVRFDGASSYVVQIPDVEGGKTYELSAWIRSDTPATGSAGIKFEYINSDGLTFAEEAHRFDPYFPWSPITAQTEAPSDAVMVRIFLRAYGPVVLDYDDAAFYEVQCP